MSEYIVDTFGIVQDFADLHGDMNTPLYRAIMNVMLSRQHEEIVRCKNCAFSVIHDGNEYPIGERGSVYCLAWSDGMQGEWTKPDGFCHKGKRKEGGDD